MNNQSVHEPEVELMSAAEVWDDAQQIAAVLRQNLLRAEPVIRLQIPLSALLTAMDTLNRDELLILRQRIDERLAA